MSRSILAARTRSRSFRPILWIPALLAGLAAGRGAGQTADPDAVLERVEQLRAADRLEEALGEVRDLAAALPDAPAWFRGDLGELERSLAALAAEEPGSGTRDAMHAAARHLEAYEAAHEAGDRAAALEELRAAIERTDAHVGATTREALWLRVDLAWTLGIVQDAAGSRDAALAVAAAARDAGLAMHPLFASAQSTLGYAQLKLGRVSDARAAFTAARAVWAELDPEFPRLRDGRAVPVTGLAMLENALGNHAEADALFAEAIALTRESPGEDSVSWANLTNNVGSAFLQRGEPALAEPFLRRSLAAKLRLHPPGHPSVLNSLANLAALLLATGDYASAEDLVGEAAAGLAELDVDAGAELQTVSLLLNLAQADLSRGDLPSAREHAARAVAIGRRAFPDQPVKLETSFLVLIHVDISLAIAGGDDAAAAAEEASALLAELADAVGAPSASMLVAESRLALLRGDVDAAAALGDEALDLVDGETGRFAAAVRAHRGRVALELGELEHAADLMLEAARLLDEARMRAEPGLARAVFGGTRHWTELASIRAALGDDEGAWEAAERGRGRVLLELLGADVDPARAGIAEPAPLERVARALGEDELLVGWARGADDVGNAGLWTWSLRAGGAPTWVFAPGDPSARIVAFRDGLADAAFAAFPAEPGAEDALARELFDALLAPILGALEDAGAVRALTVVPAEPVLGVPIEALKDAGGRTVDERFRVSYAPSGSVLARLREHADAAPGSEALRVLALGDPPFREEHRAPPEPGAASERRTAGRGPRDRVVHPHALPRLVASRGEAEAVAALFDEPTVLVGARASERALRGLDLASFDVLHFATHALVDDERPERSALVLSQVDLPDPLATALTEGRIDDGLWTGADIARGPRLAARLVTLSACDTALGRAVPGEGYLGLADAFLQAGAGAVVASLWSVDDRASALFMARFYAAWRGGATRAEALRDARAALRTHAERGARPYAHPGTWAAFVLIGDGR